jgi:hypothetical protein
MITSAFGVNRTWTGAVNTDFNNVGNWSGGGSLASTDNYTIALTSSSTITLSASITVNNLVVTINNGSASGKLRVLANTLTVNGLAQFDAVGTLHAFSDALYVDVSTGGNIIFNGQCNFHYSGGGSTYLTTNDQTGATGNPGCTVYFNGGLQVGTSGRTVGGYEPNMVFDGTGSQTAVIKCSGGGYMFKAHNLTFGSANTPTVTIRGAGATYFDTYDGNMTIGANTTVIVPDTAVVGKMTELDRYSTGSGTFTMGAGAYLYMGCPNDGTGSVGSPPSVLGGFATYSLNATSVVSYNSTGWQAIQPITYGYLILDGAGSVCDKYANGNFTVQSDWTIQGSCIFKPRKTGGITATINGNTLIQTSAVFNASSDNSYPSSTFNFLGNFTNNSSWTNGSTVGASTAIFNGTANQTIGGSVSTNFYNLTCNKASGTLYLGIKTLVGTSSAGVMSFQAGPMDLNAYTLEVVNPATTAVTRTSGYAISEQNTSVNNSILKWDISSTTGAHVFPFGTTGGSYIPFTFNNSGASGNISVSTRPTSNACSSPSGASGACNQPWAGASDVAAVANMNDATGADISILQVVDRWWDITTSAALPIPTTTLSFTYVGAENTLNNPTGTLAVQHWNGSVWDNGNNGGSGTYVSTGSAASQSSGPHTVTASGFRYFSPYVLIESSVVLPIELVSFAAKCASSKVEITWETASEQNNDYFTIEKSLDGINFYTLNTVNASGNNSRGQKYHSEDNESFNGIVYYRLKQTDKNGASKTFHVISASGCGSAGSSVAVYPNPSAGSFNVDVAGKAGDQVSVSVMDVVGRECVSRSGFLSKDLETIAVEPLIQLAPGVYTVIITLNEAVHQKKMVIN